MNKLKRIGVIVPAVIVLAVVLFVLSAVTVYPNQYVLVKQFGEIVAVHQNEGIAFKIPGLQTTQTVSKSIQIYDLAVSDVITKDKKTMVADCFALWRVEDVNLFATTLNANMSTAQSRINTTVYNSLKNVISNTTQQDVISGRDGQLVGAIMENVGNSLDKYGIELLSVETKMLDLPDDNKNAVYQRMISERNNIGAAFMAEGEEEAKKIRNEADAAITVLLSEASAEADKLVAEGEAEYMRIMSNAYNDASKAEFYEFVIQLDAMEKSFENGNGTLIIDGNSPLAELFN